MNLPPPVRAAVEQVLQLLADGKFDEVDKLTRGVRLKGKWMAEAIREYGRTLVPPPADALALADVIQVDKSEPPQWSIWMPLWTVEEGRSDLSIQLTVKEQSGGSPIIEVDGIRVL